MPTIVVIWAPRAAVLSKFDHESAAPFFFSMVVSPSAHRAIRKVMHKWDESRSGGTCLH